MNNSQHDLVILRRLSLPCRPKKAPRIISIHWFPLLSGWVKVIVDGSAQVQPGVISSGGVFRNSRGFVLGCFASKIGIRFSFEAELLGAMIAIECASLRFSLDRVKLYLCGQSSSVPFKECALVFFEPMVKLSISSFVHEPPCLSHLS
ncbi:Ribonuclease H-like domain containing protein [Trema orientale]|uniref:Ribonuclease H-like domain containing protein n=1 Tax=Trema orientale TaxID=63057 RepID=A0A2P5EHW0_TREOI|nr:Ribonuclease H-like domain containing protein [Trema orientale]